MINIPILLTVARIIIVPFLVRAILAHQFEHAVILLFCAAISDALDGALARLWQQETKLGALLDPVADKLLVVACYAALMSIDSEYFTIPRWFIGLVVAREVLILAGAAYWGLMKRKMAIAPRLLGKLTTALQLLFIGFLLGISVMQMALPTIFNILFSCVTICVVASLFDYIRIAYKRVVV